MSSSIESEYKNRIKRLQLGMQLKEISGFVITQNVDLYYFTGSMQTGYLFVPVTGDPIYYVRRSFLRALEEATTSKVVSLGSFRRFGDQLRDDFPHIFNKHIHSPVI